MVLGKKLLVFLLLLLVSRLNVILAMENTAKASLCLFGVGATLLVAQKAPESTIGKGIITKLNISHQDAKNIIGMTGSLACLGYGLEFALGSNSLSDGFKELALLTPVAAAVTKTTTTSTFQNIVKQVPMIGNHASCANTSCFGICHDCQLTKGTILIGAYALSRKTLLPFALGV